MRSLNWKTGRFRRNSTHAHLIVLVHPLLFNLEMRQSKMHSSLSFVVKQFVRRTLWKQQLVVSNAHIFYARCILYTGEED